MELEIPELLKIINEKIGPETAKQVEEIIKDCDMWRREVRELRLNSMYRH